MMFKRNLTDKLKKMLSWSPVVLLTGARQTGKTTLMKEVLKDTNYTYITFDDDKILKFAQEDPHNFIAQLKKPVILDEVQRAPELFLTIKMDVDENRQNGMYALTGSANLFLIPRLGDSLAGRMMILELFPLSQGELIGVQENFIDTLFKGIIPDIKFDCSITDLFKKIGLGGYPAINSDQNYDHLKTELWFKAYVDSLLKKDIKDIAAIDGITALPYLLNLLAARAGNLLNVANLSRESKIPSTTLHRYLTLLETVFLVHFQRPWSRNMTSRLVKSPKVYFNDTGLLCFLLGINFENYVPHGGMFTGILLENFVINELIKQAGWTQKRVEVYYYRTVSGIEVDVVIEDAQGNIIGIEIKSSGSVSVNDFKGLRHLQEVAQEKFVQGIVLYTGQDTLQFDKKLCALPINALWTLY
ncbi:MAG: ATP-binding protein [Gammaproteobacteria bacterium]|nr:ATP-binding protein [Gammaproteobacteria bacterium]